MSSEPPSKKQKTELSDEDLAHQFRVDFKNQLSKEILILLVDFLQVQLKIKLTPQEFLNSKNDLTGDKLCKLLSDKGFINSLENIKTTFRNLLAKVNEDDQFNGLTFLYQWLEQWIATPGFRSKNKSELAANVESKLFMLMEKDLKRVKENNKFIIHPLCTDLINEKIGDKLVLERVLEFLNESKKKVLLILGNAGSGKSTCCQMILRLLWARYNFTSMGEGEIPLFASLPTIPNPSIQIVAQVFYRAGVNNADQQTYLKENRVVHFILDGYDELFGQVDLFSQTDLGKFNGKIIISCRNESLPDLNLLSPQNSEIMKIYLTPLSEGQSIEYLSDVAASRNVDQKLVEQFQKLVDSVPSLKEFIQTPFHLKIITEILPEVLTKLNEGNVNRYEIYELFIRNRINPAVNRPGIKLNLVNIQAQMRQLPNAVIRQCIEWSIQMRNEKSTSLSFDISKSEIANELRSLAGLETKEQILRWLSPLLIEENGNIVNCSFIHATIGEFFLIFRLNEILSETKSTPEKKLNEIKNHPIFSKLLGISTWQFISDLVKSNQELKKEIWNLIDLSRKSDEFSTVAANCASVWNICGFSFSRQDLSSVKIPGASLSRANFYGTDLRNANLKGCKLKDSILSEANLKGANLSEVDFGELPSWQVGPNCKIFTFGEDNLIVKEISTLTILNLSTMETEHVISLLGDNNSILPTNENGKFTTESKDGKYIAQYTKDDQMFRLSKIVGEKKELISTMHFHIQLEKILFTNEKLLVIMDKRNTIRPFNWTINDLPFSHSRHTKIEKIFLTSYVVSASASEPVKLVLNFNGHSIRIVN